MTFIRLAGCSVGKRYPAYYYEGNKDLIPVYTEECTLYDGRHFPCDTDYRVKQRLTASEIVALVPKDVSDVCITGGEPLIHDLSTLITFLWEESKTVHIETSGTIEKYLDPMIWVTVSPKMGILERMIDRANELKVLVDENFDPEIPISFSSWAKRKPVYLQPINGENDINGENLQLCRQWQEKYPAFRISVQLHKVMSQYVGELVR